MGNEGLKKVTVYTDGACSGNPGPGGWGAVLMYKENEKILRGGKKLTTNNEMELTAVVEALSALTERCAVTVYSDSSYVVNAVEKGWIWNWSRNGWKNSKKETLPNLELWQKLYSLLSQQEVTFRWVKGHADNKYNELCDRIAVEEREKFA